MDRICVIFPCHRESQETVQRGVDAIRSLGKRFGVKTSFVVAQNGDGERLVFDDLDVKVVFVKERGYGTAVRRAIRKSDGRYIYISSPDYPFGLMDLEQMLVKRKSYDFLVGSKLHSDSVYVIGWKRKWTSKILSVLIKYMFWGFPISDTNGSLFFDGRRGRKYEERVKSKDFFLCTELAFYFYKDGLKMMEVPVTYINYGVKTKVNLSLDGIRYFVQLLKLRLRLGSTAN